MSIYTGRTRPSVGVELGFSENTASLLAAALDWNKMLKTLSS